MGTAQGIRASTDNFSLHSAGPMQLFLEYIQNFCQRLQMYLSSIGPTGIGSTGLDEDLSAMLSPLEQPSLSMSPWGYVWCMSVIFAVTHWSYFSTVATTGCGQFHCAQHTAQKYFQFNSLQMSPVIKQQCEARKIKARLITVLSAVYSWNHILLTPTKVNHM